MSPAETNSEAEARHVGEALSIEVISTRLDGLKQIFEQGMGFQNRELNDIKVQTTKTNGSVAAAFKKIDDNKTETDAELLKFNKWRERIVGGGLVVSAVVIPAILGMLIYLIKLHISN